MEQVRELRERLGLGVRVFGELEAPPKGPTAPKPAIPRSVVIMTTVPERDPQRRPRDGSRTCFESRIAIPSAEVPEEIPAPTPRFTVREMARFTPHAPGRWNVPGAVGGALPRGTPAGVPGM